MKIIILHILKYLGIFSLSRKLISNEILIITYHGFEIIDESSFRPALFIKPETFAKRLQFLKTHCNVIPLSDVLNFPTQNKNSVIITIDDGWYSTLLIAAPLLREYDFPYTLYLTTENVLDNQPIFHVVLDYLLQNSLGKPLNIGNNRLSNKIEQESIEQLKEQINRLKNEKNDTNLLQNIATNLGIDLKPIIEQKPFSLLSSTQVKLIKEKGADIQLHSHIHYTPSNEKDFIHEINRNRECIENITNVTPEHFCYPSGKYTSDNINYLNKLNIKTATTCNKGFCSAKSKHLELPRFLDGEHIPQIIFEAEVSGVMEIIRNLANKLQFRS